MNSTFVEPQCCPWVFVEKGFGFSYKLVRAGKELLVGLAPGLVTLVEGIVRHQ